MAYHHKPRAAKVRKIGGEKCELYSTHRTKRTASRAASYLRSKGYGKSKWRNGEGKSGYVRKSAVHIVKNTHGYAVYLKH